VKFSVKWKETIHESSLLTFNGWEKSRTRQDSANASKNLDQKIAFDGHCKMADIQGWLRGFQRARIPNVITPPAHLSLLDETNETAEEMHGAPSTSRMSYYQSFGRLTARSLSTESQPHLNQVEQIWHNPDPDQMAETLKVAMMTQDSFDPLRVPFNSCILHVLEAYQHMRKELIEKDCEIRDREQRHENDIKEFTQQKLRWKRKEDEYKSEMKKLEVMLATRARGLELLMLARSSSALNGTTRAKATESQQVEKESELQHVASDKGSLFKTVLAYL